MCLKMKQTVVIHIAVYEYLFSMHQLKANMGYWLSTEQCWGSYFEIARQATLIM